VSDVDHRLRGYRRVQNLVIGVYFGVPVLFLVLLFPWGWKKALVAAALAGLAGYFLIKLASGNARFKRVSKVMNELWRQAAAGAMPTFVFELHRVNDVTGLTGGSFHLAKQ
jgi:hypothetical protein